MEKNEEKRRLKLPGTLIILLCLFCFIFLLGLGLVTADYSFNKFTGRENRVPIFAFNINGNGRYRIDFLGESREIEIKTVLQAVQKTNRFIKSVFNEGKIFK